MHLGRVYARAGADPALIAEVAALLHTRWDPDGEFAAPDGSQQPEAHARTILGILATGADTAGVMGYLRRAGEVALGTPRTTGRERSALAKAAWRAMLDSVARSTHTPDNAARAT